MTAGRRWTARRAIANAFRAVAAEDHFRKRQDLWLSSIGVGTYLGDADEETDARYAEAVARAVELGANVIDTAANYRFQRSERSIGAALRELNARGFARDEIVVCTKGGYLPFDGAPPRDVRQYIEDTFVKPGIASFADIAGGSHCMTPRYLQSQLSQSLRNMNLVVRRRLLCAQSRVAVGRPFRRKSFGSVCARRLNSSSKVSPTERSKIMASRRGMVFALSLTRVNIIRWSAWQKSPEK